MRSTRENRRSEIANRYGKGLAFVWASVLLFLAVLLVAAAAPEKHLAVYSTAANYSLPVLQRQGPDYIGLLELLDPLGTVSAKSDPPRWRLHYNNILGEFTVGKRIEQFEQADVILALP